jgi:serine/threonine protein phosphatase PrpC
MEPPFVPATPQTTSRVLTSSEAEGGFVLLASDGVWEVLPNEKAAKVVRDALASGATPHDAAAALCDAALAKRSEDNIGVCVVML